MKIDPPTKSSLSIRPLRGWDKPVEPKTGEERTDQALDAAEDGNRRARSHRREGKHEPLDTRVAYANEEPLGDLWQQPHREQDEQRYSDPHRQRGYRGRRPRYRVTLDVHHGR